MEPIMLVLAIVCTVLGVIIGDCAQWVRNASFWQKISYIIGGATLFAIGISMLAHIIGML